MYCERGVRHQCKILVTTWGFVIYHHPHFLFRPYQCPLFLPNLYHHPVLFFGFFVIPYLLYNKGIGHLWEQCQEFMTCDKWDFLWVFLFLYLPASIRFFANAADIASPRPAPLFLAYFSKSKPPSPPTSYAVSLSYLPASTASLLMRLTSPSPRPAPLFLIF